MFVAIIGATAVLLLQVMREQGAHSPGIQVIIYGGLVMLAGNLLQVGLPGNTFPFDALSGIVFAALLMYALYKRRMFRLTLVVSRSLLTLVLAVICAIAAANFISPCIFLPSRPWGWTSAPPPRWCPWRLPDCWAAHTFSCGGCWRPCSPGKSSKAAW